jgi:hypothetical protein
MMTNIKVVSDPSLIHKLESKLEHVVEKPWHLKEDWIRKNNWAAVPVEKGRHFEEAEAEATSHALRTIGCTECSAIATEPLGESPNCYRIAATKEGLLAFSRECAGLNFALIDENLSFIILCTSEDYNIVAGPSSFVESVLGLDLNTARKRFRDFASDAIWEGQLLATAERYERL